jgi:hypothetical protein
VRGRRVKDAGDLDRKRATVDVDCGDYASGRGTVRAKMIVLAAIVVRVRVSYRYLAFSFAWTSRAPYI